jgi:membrane-associated protein
MEPLNIFVLNLAVSAAAIIGDTVGYWIGAKAGPKLFTREKSLFFSRKHLLRTKEFYERHGGKTIILARFVPIVRTYVPFVAGVGTMPYLRYLAFCVLGAVIWVVSLCLAGYWFGNQPIVKNNLTAVILIIVVISVLPGFFAWLRSRRPARVPPPL